MRKITILLSMLIAVSATNAQTFQEKIERNNVRAHVVSGGLLFNNLGNGKGGFEAPKNISFSGDSLFTIYGSSLWLGGIDAGGKQYIAAQTYRQAGNDYGVGPIDLFTNQHHLYDKLWRIKKADIDLLKANGTASKNISEWPGVFTSLNGTEKLAPFFDNNGNGIYDHLNGDYPIFPGDEALFFIYNDDTIHTESKGIPLFFDVKGFVYQYRSFTNEFLNNTVFVDYYLSNRSNRTYTYVNAGIWTDFDLGDFKDDRTGTSPLKNMYYAYNANDSDAKYGNTPPAMGVKVLDQPLYSSMRASSVLSQNSPTIDSQYFYLMNGKFSDGTVMTDKGTGYNTGGDVTRFLFNGNPCTNTGWTEERAGSLTGDRRMLGSVRFENFKPDEERKFTVAYTWSRAKTGGAISSLCKLFDQTDSLQTWYDAQPSLSTKSLAKIDVTIYPNPASQKVFIDIPNYDNINIELYSVTGKLIYTSNSKTIDVSQLAKGLYIIKGKAGESYFTEKLRVE